MDVSKPYVYLHRDPSRFSLPGMSEMNATAKARHGSLQQKSFISFSCHFICIESRLSVCS